MSSCAQARRGSAPPEDLADRPPRSAPSDRALLGFVVAIHAVPLAALATGHVWGQGTLGYATAVTVVAGRELARELLSSWRASQGGGR